MPSLVFKGGTSLSKCYGIIKRFSEDIDIHYATNKKPTQGEKRQFKKGIEQAIENAGLILENGESIRSRRDHNNYEVRFPQIVEFSDSIKKELLVDTFVPIKSFPSEERSVSSYILQYLQHEEEFEVIKQYYLKPFKLNVQRIDRTFIDKVFAICDYYEHKNYNRNSRHLYDLHKILEAYQFEEENFQLLFELVREERQQRPEINVSSEKGYNVRETLGVILKRDVFKEDYNDITKSLLFEEVSYKEVKDSLYKLLQQGLIPSYYSP